MFHGMLIGLIHEFVSWLLYPVIIMLFLAVLLTIIEVGLVFAERIYTLRIYRKGPIDIFEDYAAKRLERSDLLARCGPILGLMGTLIPLGPGLNALGAGNIDILATALSVAFDTTVVGLLVGLVAFVISRLRRRWYDQYWHLMQQGE
ncbi:MAG: MotA/TolQ/ExbB proton channel family protein [Pseudomonadales bacterium]|nr:MotA/TolQ/ExbB proton channel family protein [Pseudomonadales bacterium]